MKRTEIALAAAINEIWQPKSKLCTSPKSLDLLTKAMMQLISTLGRDMSWGSLIWLMLCTYQSDWLEVVHRGESRIRTGKRGATIAAKSTR
jgi:hypothetical protein